MEALFNASNATGDDSSFFCSSHIKLRLPKFIRDCFIPVSLGKENKSMK